MAPTTINNESTMKFASQPSYSSLVRTTINTTTTEGANHPNLQPFSLDHEAIIDNHPPLPRSETDCFSGPIPTTTHTPLLPKRLKSVATLCLIEELHIHLLCNSVTTKQISKASGRSFLVQLCHDAVLFVNDLCERWRGLRIWLDLSGSVPSVNEVSNAHLLDPTTRGEFILCLTSLNTSYILFFLLIVMFFFVKLCYKKKRMYKEPFYPSPNPWIIFPWKK